MQLSEFDYNLPEELIAQTPVEPRNSSRLMVLDPVEKTIEHRHFYDLKEYLEPGDTLIMNDTRVMPARLLGWRDGTGGKVEVFLLRRIDGDTWETLVKPGRKAQIGQVVRFSDELACTVTDHTDFGGRIVKFQYEGIFEEILDRLGETPLPPYIHEKLADKERYQTVYSREQGSAAAPTAFSSASTMPQQAYISIISRFWTLTAMICWRVRAASAQRARAKKQIKCSSRMTAKPRTTGTEPGFRARIPRSGS